MVKDQHGNDRPLIELVTYEEVYDREQISHQSSSRILTPRWTENKHVHFRNIHSCDAARANNETYISMVTEYFLHRVSVRLNVDFFSGFFRQYEAEYPC